jgi:hypothetical protein
MRCLVAGVSLASIALSGAAAARADDISFLSGGAGAGGPGVAARVSLNAIRGRTYHGIRLAAAEEFAILGPTPSESVRDFGAMIGRASAGTRGLGYAAVGLGVVQSVRRGAMIAPGIWFVGPRHERIEQLTLGVPFELGAILHKGPVGVGASLFGNVNKSRSFVAVALTLQLGRMRAP